MKVNPVSDVGWQKFPINIQVRLNDMTINQVMVMASNPDISPVQGRAIERAMEGILRTVRANMTQEAFELRGGLNEN